MQPQLLVLGQLVLDSAHALAISAVVSPMCGSATPIAAGVVRFSGREGGGRRSGK